jgi:transcriptional regulator with XRE-family HTH domain
MAEEDTIRILNLLRTALRLLGITNRAVEKELGMSSGYLSRLFSGAIDLRVDHVVEITRIIGLRPAEFFHLAYPRSPEPSSATALRLRELLQGFQGAEREPAAPASPAPSAAAAPAAAPNLAGVPAEEMEKMMLRTLRKLIGDAGTSGEQPNGPRSQAPGAREPRQDQASSPRERQETDGGEAEKTPRLAPRAGSDRT